MPEVVYREVTNLWKEIDQAIGPKLKLLEDWGFPVKIEIRVAQPGDPSANFRTITE